MEEASNAPSWSLETREPSKVSTSSFVFFHDAAARQKSALPSRDRRLRFQGVLGFKLALGAIASAAALAMLIYLCAAAYLRAGPLQVTRRWLSEEGARGSNTGLVACGETRGEGAVDEVQAPPEEEELGPPPPKKAKLEEQGANADSDADSQPQTSGSGQEESASAAGAAATAPEARSPVELQVSAGEFMAAEALLVLSGQQAPSLQQPASAPVLQQQVQLPPPPQETPGVPPLSLASSPPVPTVVTATTPTSNSTISAVSSAPAGLETPRPQLAPVQPEAPPAGGAPKAPSLGLGPGGFSELRFSLLPPSGELQMIDPFKEWQPPPASMARGVSILEHAFSRLPSVEGGDSSDYSSFVDLERAVSIKATPHVQQPLLRTLTCLLAQQTLSRSQLQQMGVIIQHLVSHLALNEGRPLRRCRSFAAEALGMRFLLLDMTVSALQVLGVPRSGSWWDLMVSRIADDYEPPKRRPAEPLRRFNYDLMMKLVEAVRTLKAGHRPEPKLLVQLKRCLFCCMYSPIRFLKTMWDPWRDWDKEFYAQFEGGLGQGDSAEPGPSHQSGSGGDA
ncbi:hypothetical protein ACSSS7_000391 [Eimeria intestinalis]